MSARKIKEAKRRRIVAAPVARRPALVWAMLLLAVAGIGVTGYLAVTYFSDAQVVCYGLGQCEQVQDSAYSRVFGIPIAYFGLLSNLAIAAGVGGRLAWPDDRGYLALLGVSALAIAGTVFSAYLTYVEFFVIRATCPWCLTSAVLIALVAAMGIVQVRRQLARA